MARTKNAAKTSEDDPHIQNSRASTTDGKRPQEADPQVPKPSTKRGGKAMPQPVLPSKKLSKKTPTLKLEYVEDDGKTVEVDRYNSYCLCVFLFLFLMCFKISETN